MEQRRLGSSGLRVSVIALGGNNFGGRMDLEKTRAVVQRALDLGVTLIDTADSYPQGVGEASETFIGDILGARRKEIVLSTKFGSRVGTDPTRKGASRQYLMQAVEGSLRRLRTDWIDLYQLHRPDPLTPVDETIAGLDDLVKSGKVRYVGLGNIPAWQAIDAHWRAVTGSGFRFVSCQGEYSLVSRGVEQELVPALQAMQANLLAHFPLAGGFLSGKYRRNEPPPATARLSYHEAHARKFVSDRNWEIVERLEFFCRQRGRTLLELAIGWLAGSPAVASIIAGASTPEQMEQNVRALDWRLTDGERLEIDRLSQ